MTSQLRRKRRTTAARPSTSIESWRTGFAPRPLAFLLGAVFLLGVIAPTVEAEQAASDNPGQLRPAYSIGRNGAKLKWVPVRRSQHNGPTRLAQHTEPLTKETRPAVPRLGEPPVSGTPAGGTMGTPPGASNRYRLGPPSGISPPNTSRLNPADAPAGLAEPPAAPSFNQLRSRPAASPPGASQPPTVPIDRRLDPAPPAAPPATRPAAPEGVLEIEREREVDLGLPAPSLERPRALGDDAWGDDTRRDKSLDSYLDTMREGPDLAASKDDCKPPRDVPIDEILDMLPPPKGEGDKGNIYPPDCPMKHETFEPRHWDCLTYTWKGLGTLPQAALLRRRPTGTLRPLLGTVSPADHLRRPLLPQRPHPALQYGPGTALRVHVHPRLLPPRQLCPLHAGPDPA